MEREARHGAAGRPGMGVRCGQRKKAAMLKQPRACCRPHPPHLEDEGSRAHRSLIGSTSLCLCCVLVGGLHWSVISAGGLSLVAVSRGYALVAFCMLLIAVTSLVAEHKLQSVQASVAVACGLSCCGT